MLPRGSDVALTNKLTALHAEHPHFSRPKFASNDFIVSHYAGPVCYHSNGFLEKNRDTLQVRVNACMIMNQLSLTHMTERRPRVYVEALSDIAENLKMHVLVVFLVVWRVLGGPLVAASPEHCGPDRRALRRKAGRPPALHAPQRQAEGARRRDGEFELPYRELKSEYMNFQIRKLASIGSLPTYNACGTPISGTQIFES